MFESRSTADPKQRIVEAAIGEIERHGIPALTVRKVAAAAGVNIAAINYHFGSKDALVARVLEQTLAHMLADADQYLARGQWTALFRYLLEGTSRYPRITKAHLHAAFAADDYSGAFAARFHSLVDTIAAHLRERVPRLGRRAAVARVVRALSAVLFPTIFSGLFTDLGETRARYVQGVVDQLLA